MITALRSHGAQSVPSAINLKLRRSKFGCTFCSRGVDEDKPASSRFTSLLRGVASKGVERSLSVFKASGHEREVGSCLILPHKHLQSAAGGQSEPRSALERPDYKALVDWWDFCQVLSEASRVLR